VGQQSKPEEMMAKCKIEWQEDPSVEGLVGKVGGLPILEVTGRESRMFDYTVFEYEELECAGDFDREKNRLEKHFFEWLGKISYMSGPDEMMYVGDGKGTIFSVPDQMECVTELPEGEKCVSMITFNNTIYVALSRSIFVLDGDVLRPVEFDLSKSYCQHGKYMTDYCEPCGRVNGGG
jgi:hypothetical protein